MTESAADISVKKTETTLTHRDRLGMLKMRIGIGRASYRIEPGIYAAGNPDSMSPVLVSSNYKMSFDMECGACAKNCPVSAIKLTPGVGCATYILQTWLRKDKAKCGCGIDECY